MGCLVKLLLLGLVFFLMGYFYSFMSNLDPHKQAIIKEVAIEAKEDFIKKANNLWHKFKNLYKK